jgi:hypothetical protein
MPSGPGPGRIARLWRVARRAIAAKPLDRDEKVKIDLPFKTALRALSKTPPPESERSSAGTPRKF